MNSIAKEWDEYIKLIDEQIKINEITNKSLSEWCKPLLESINVEGLIPYLIGTGERYRASPLSSIITWMDNAGLIPISILDKLQDKLIYLRDYNADDNDIGNVKKKDEDIDGWSLGEGVSVWSTSCAIIALLDYHSNGIKKALSIKKSVLWLAKQQNINDKGWGYQLYDNCNVNPIMSALAIRALSLAMSKENKEQFEFTQEEERLIISSLASGFEYIQKSREGKKEKYYWTFDNVPNCAATTWVLLALQQLIKVDELKDKNCEQYFQEVLNSSLEFIVSRMPNRNEKWDNEQIVKEGGAKYSKQKNYFSFSATLLPQLFVLGLSPFHPKVLYQIYWILDNPAEWNIIEYDKSVKCTFTYAMVLSTLCIWRYKVGMDLASKLVCHSKSKGRVLEKIYGYQVISDTPFQFVRKNRIIMLSFLIIIVIILFVFTDKVSRLIFGLSNYISQLWYTTGDDRHVILINIIASVIYTALGVVCIGIFKKISKIILKNRGKSPW